MRVILAGGGTGGHLFPAIAVAEALIKINIEPLFVVSNRKNDEKILDQKKHKYIQQKVLPFKGVTVLNKLKSIFFLIIEVFKSLKLLRQGDKVLLFGGFASASMGIAGILRRNEIYIHEQNAVMGLTNRILAPYARKVFLSFYNTGRVKGKMVVTGNPVRNEFLDVTFKEKLGMNIVITGGSQGSRYINKLIVASAKKLLEKGFCLVHQTGIKLYNETVYMYQECGIKPDDSLKIYPFIDNIKNLYEWTDIIISRAGSGSLFEAIYAKRPTIFIPLKLSADNHQMHNAIYAQKMGFAKIITEEEGNTDKLIGYIEEVHKSYDKMAQNFKNVKIKNSADIIIMEMEVA